MTDSPIHRAARSIRDAEAILITAGAGMGVDSGLPDFRGDSGFWKAYPAFQKLGLRFVQLANPMWFENDPALAWGFYGHRRNLYHATPPHAGFGILLRWAELAPAGYFVFTSNVDGHFAKAGFREEFIDECHGSIRHLQCSRPCSPDIWDADDAELPIDETTMRAAHPLPACPRCGGLARPNVLMFGDYGWLSQRNNPQRQAFRHWLDSITGRRLAIVECGAGTAVPTVRMISEEVASDHRGALIRINVRESDGPARTISLPMGALDALQQIDAAI